MWCHEKKSFEAFDNEEIPEDDIDSLTKFCSEQLKCAIESINPDLKFEMELEQDFYDHKLPTLDCNIWISRPHDQAPAIEFDFYEKPMKSKYVVMEKSAMDYQQKVSILSNAGVLRQNFKKAVYCLRSIILASEVYFLAQYQYIYAIFIVVLG